MVTLRKRINTSGTVSLYLDYYSNGKRHREFLKITYSKNTKNKSELIKHAEAIRAQRELDLVHRKAGTFNPAKSHVSFNKYFESQLKGLQRKDNWKFIAALKHFNEFAGPVTFTQLNKELFTRYVKYLQGKVNSETLKGYFTSVKYVLRLAISDGFLASNPASDIRLKTSSSSKMLTKQVLWLEEIKKLFDTPCKDSELKRAFLFATQTALRPNDIRSLEWSDIHFESHAKYLKIRQNKTGEPLVVFLNAAAINLLGKRKKSGKVFMLKSHDNRKALNTWVRSAGIDKHITFYCARHSAITNVMHKTDLKTASVFAGHTSTRMTERYTHVINKHLINAADLISVI